MEDVAAINENRRADKPGISVLPWGAKDVEQRIFEGGVNRRAYIVRL